MPKGFRGFQKGVLTQHFKHKDDCKCVRCIGSAWNKGIRYTEEQKAKLNLAGLEKGRGLLKGKKMSEISRRKMSEAKKGKVGILHNSWKGDKAKYSALHMWIRYHKGRASHCSKCGENSPNKKYQWANISRTYKRELNDWMSLCIQCHKRYDLEEIRNGKFSVDISKVGTVIQI